MSKEVLEQEFAQFLTLSTKEELKTVAVENVLGLTGTADGKKVLNDMIKVLEGLISLTEDSRTDIKEMVFKSLINLAVDEQPALQILTLKKYDDIIIMWMNKILDPKFKLADIVCKLVSNITRHTKCAEIVSKKFLESKEVSINRLVMVLCNLIHNDNADLHYLGAILSNLSQVREVREKIMDKEQCVVQRLLPFTDFKQSSIRRGGIIGTLKNCCFDTEYHEWLLSDEVDLLPRLLLPLAGPEEFDDDDTERLPDDLQYLPPDKERESDATIRKMLSEAILQLCATKKGKAYVKEKNTYVIMREYYSWEREREPLNEIAAMNLIDVLIGDEPTEQFGDNLKEVEIPDDMKKKFEEDDTKEIEQAKKEMEEMQEKETENSAA